MSAFNEERLGKIVELARRGASGERENAQDILRKLCIKYGLEYEEVLNGGAAVKEYRLTYRTAEEHRLLCQVVSRYAKLTMEDSTWINRGRKTVMFKTTEEKYIETANAWDVLRPLFAKEKKRIADALFMGFLEKHWLYYTPTEEEHEAHLKQVLDGRVAESEEEARARRMGESIAGQLEDADILKRIGP